MPEFYFARLKVPAKIGDCVECGAVGEVIEGCAKSCTSDEVAAVDLGERFRPAYFPAYYCKSCFDRLTGE